MKYTHKDTIDNSVEYIESRLTDKLAIDELAGHVYSYYMPDDCAVDFVT